MKKLTLKNLTVKKISSEEQLNVKGGTKSGDVVGTRGCHNSSAMSCNQTSAWPIDCNSATATYCWFDMIE